MKKKKWITIGLGASLLIGGGWGAWNCWFSPTRIAFVNYQAIVLGEIAKSNQNASIRIFDVKADEVEHLDRYDMVFVNAMGLTWTEEQREQVRAAEKKGVPVLSVSVTNPDNAFCSVDSLLADSLRTYLKYGGRKNYRSLLNLVRTDIDGKRFGAEPVLPATEPEIGLFYHAAPGQDGGEPLEFQTLKEYRQFLRRQGLWKEQAPQIILAGHMGEPEPLVAQLEAGGNMVFPTRSLQALIEAYGDSLQPSAVVYMPHGRLGDDVVDYLKSRNIPLLTALNVNAPLEEWQKNRQGMQGGFLSQSIATPELDGAVRPYVVFALQQNADGVPVIQAIPERLATFVEYVNRVVSLRNKQNREKKIAVFYYKGPGQSALTASGMEVVPSLYNLLLRLRKEGYRVEGLPETPEALGKLIQTQGSVFNLYAEGAFDAFLKNGNPLWIPSDKYAAWVKDGLSRRQREQADSAYGAFPGIYFGDAEGRMGLARLEFGNVVLVPQAAAALGDNSFQIVHGVDAPPPHNYLASYLWVRYGFRADALIHFGTHGSLEFTPGKQVALGDDDWPDRLVGPLPHFYVYSIGNVGEGVIAKRRSYATLQSYLTPPFLESGVRSEYRALEEALKTYYALQDGADAGSAKVRQASLRVKELAVKLGFHRDLGLDSLLATPYGEEDIARIDQFAEELATEQITGQLYTLGVPYEPARIHSSVLAMTAEPVAYSKLALDRQRGLPAAARADRQAQFFTQNYLNPARALVNRLLDGLPYSETVVTRHLGITQAELDWAHEVMAEANRPKDMMAMMRRGMHPSAAPAKEYSREDREKARLICEAEQAVRRVPEYRLQLENSPEQEMKSLTNALSGGYTAPSPGGDPIANPNTLPTGRNLYSVNAEATPSEAAWEKGKKMAEQTLEMYRRRHHDSLPQKVSYTLWSSEFIETEGATIAQVLYMLGVEPVRDAFGRVSDLRLIPSRELGRPRIDVVVQTSGQMRDIAASRLFLITRAVEMAAAAKDDLYENQVAVGVVAAERALTAKGMTPKEAREVAYYRVFGGVNGHYATGIQAMVEAGDQWEKSSEIAEVYLNNMGAYYGSEDKWQQFRKAAFEAALTGTDAVVQPRQSNTWGALSLDHVYEFMGGLNLAVRQVTGKEPDAYLSDYRNRNRNRMQEIKEAVGVEGRTTLLNPVYIKEKMKGGAGAAAVFATTVRNTYGWNVMKPEAIDAALWNDIYEVYVKDKYQLGLHEFFERESPAALQELTAVMLETARKGLWKATDGQLRDLSELHTKLVNTYRPACTEFVCDNAKLQSFIKEHAPQQAVADYSRNIQEVRQTASSDQKGMVMKKEEMNSSAQQEQKQKLNGVTVFAAVSVILIAMLVWFRKKRRKE